MYASRGRMVVAMLLSQCKVNARILLANLLQSSRSTFSRGSFLSFLAFKEGMLGTPISVLGGWPTVSARYRYMIRKGQFYRHNVHGNSVHKSMSSWWLAWKFLDSTRVVWVPGPDLLS